MKKALVNAAFLFIPKLAYHNKYWYQWIWYVFAMCWFFGGGFILLIISLPFKHKKQC